ncbi:MAG: plastocyanin [Parcubacteria group bacterium Greene0714_7]|nr:MAG: plastocyanin [Parcubacteria group bacterium Greene0714_7]
MKNKPIIIFAVVLLLALGSWYYFSQKSSTDSLETTETQVTGDTPSLPAGGMETGELSASDTTAPEVKEFTIASDHFSFVPNSMQVKKGDRVKITFSNPAGTHDFKIDEFSVATAKLSAGQNATVEFVADKAGAFEYYCSVGNHRAMGMWGTLVVTE